MLNVMSHHPWFAIAANKSLCKNWSELDSQGKKDVILSFKFKATDYVIMVKI